MLFKSPYPEVVLPRVPLTTFFLDRIHKFGNKPALIDSITGRTLTYAQLADGIRKAAGALSARGMHKGDTVAIYSPNCPEYAIAFHAVSLIGGIVTTISPLCTAPDIKKQLLDSKAIFLITLSALLETAKQGIERTSVQEIFTFDSNPGATPFSELTKADLPVPDVMIDPVHDVVALPYSSGTTGFPKGVMLTHYNLVSNILQIEGIPDFELARGEDVALAFLPFFHIYGMVVVMNMFLVRGATLVTLPRFDLTQFLELVTRYKVTVCNVVPPVMVALAKHPDVSKYDLSSLRLLMSGAAPLSKELGEAVSKRLKCQVMQGYGMTETSPVTHMYDLSKAKLENLGSIGYPVINTQIKIIDTQTGLDLGVGERGELCCRGPQVMKGYLNNPEATASTIDPGGWLHTGDIGYVDENGLFYVVDRLKELIKYNGFQVAPAELEALLLTHPEVGDAAVVPLQDAEAGEIPKAFLVRKPGSKFTESEIIEWVARQVAPQKKIRQVEFIDVIPKSATGKILRRILVEKDRAKVTSITP